MTAEPNRMRHIAPHTAGERGKDSTTQQGTQYLAQQWTGKSNLHLYLAQQLSALHLIFPY